MFRQEKSKKKFVKVFWTFWENLQSGRSYIWYDALCHGRGFYNQCAEISRYVFQITGAKAPPLKHLKEWLEQNPTYDVDPKWGELIRAKVSWSAVV